MGFYKFFAKPLLFCLNPELAHELSLLALKLRLVAGNRADKFTGLQLNIAGLQFQNPLGLAAGYDKNALVINPLSKLGFSHVEVGTVTPNAQRGNEKPRMFRLQKQGAILNRLGFNNRGSEFVFQQLKKTKKSKTIIGVNIGANKLSENFINDYVYGIKKFSGIADYITLNISSPNTKGLRELQNKNQLAELFTKIKNETEGAKLFLKIAPDIVEAEMDDIAKLIETAPIAALLISNTTISHNEKNTGGLSGKPLFNLSTKVLAKMFVRIGDKIPLIGVGGIDSGETAWQKIEAGASLVQLYTGLVYGGPKLIGEILNFMNKKMQQENLHNIKQAVGRNANEWAKNK